MRILYVLLWFVLAITTLLLVVLTGNALASALAAWTGGLMTLKLYDQYREGHPR